MTDEAAAADARAQGFDRADIGVRLAQERRRVLFAIGVVKTRWTHAHPLGSGLEILLIGAFAGIVGYLFGNVLPKLLGTTAIGG